MGRSPCCDKLGLKKGPWTPEEDQKLLAYIDEHGHGNWRALPTKAGLQRCGKSCRLRWTNYLRPDIKRGKFSLQEEQTIIQLHALLGNRWSAIATHLPKRTDNEIKNYWNTHLKKRLAKMGIDPVTHKPKNDALLSVAASDGPHQSKNAAHLSHMAQWESARLEAEARLARQSKLRPSNHHPPSSSLSPMNNFSGACSGSSTTSSAIATTPRCLDVLKAWHTSVWPSGISTTSATTEGIAGIGGINNNIGLGFESPTSTLSFSAVGPNGGTVIEFMGHTDSSVNNHNSNDTDQLDERLVKEEDDGQDGWKVGFHHHHDRYDDHHGMMENPLPVISTSSDDDHNEHHGHHQNFMEGFTELLLSTTTASTTTITTASVEKSLVEECGTETDNNNNDSDNNNNSNNNNCDSSGGSGSSSDYYEDNKNYWNSILNLVDSSPSDSPSMF